MFHTLTTQHMNVTHGSTGTKPLFRDEDGTKNGLRKGVSRLLHRLLDWTEGGTTLHHKHVSDRNDPNSDPKVMSR